MCPKKHTANYYFAVCQIESTWWSLTSPCATKKHTVNHYFAVCQKKHTAKYGFAVCLIESTRRTIGHTATFDFPVVMAEIPVSPLLISTLLLLLLAHVGSMPLQFLEIGFHVEIHAIEWHDFQHETQFHGVVVAWIEFSQNSNTLLLIGMVGIRWVVETGFLESWLILGYCDKDKDKAWKPQ